YRCARSSASGRPQLIIARTEIARGIPEVAGSPKGHGEAGARHGASARTSLGLPADDKFHVSDEVREYFAQHRLQLEETFGRWQAIYDAWRRANPEKAAML